MKLRRQAAILELVDREIIRSQEQLRKRLRAMGMAATQATLSRDIRDLSLVKRAADGAYQRPIGEPGNPAAAMIAFERAVAEYVTRIDQVQQLLVVRTGRGQAQSLGEAIDRADLAEVVGTLAGDDTILVIASDAGTAQELRRRVLALLRPARG